MDQIAIEQLRFLDLSGKSVKLTDQFQHSRLLLIFLRHLA
jgi:hypothetical protein